LGLEKGGEVPKQEFLDAADGMVRDPGQHGAEIEFRIEAVELGRPNDAVHVSGTLAAAPPKTVPWPYSANREFDGLIAGNIPSEH
jgi:hypothetical protein